MECLLLSQLKDWNVVFPTAPVKSDLELLDGRWSHVIRPPTVTQRRAEPLLSLTSTSYVSIHLTLRGTDAQGLFNWYEKKTSPPPPYDMTLATYNSKQFFFFFFNKNCLQVLSRDRNSEPKPPGQQSGRKKSPCEQDQSDKEEPSCWIRTIWSGVGNLQL